jgi:molybdopterin/thiamine biosynthesis adenylyltransferase
MKHPLIIGAGGVASYLLPVLLKAFKPEQLTIYDKDILEERNLDRQMFKSGLVGSNKAHALIATLANDFSYELLSKGTEFVAEWFTASTVVPDSVDAIICVADNHEARRNAIQAAYDKGIRCYLGGNEYFDSEAYVTWADHAGTKADPRIRYPLIATSTEGSPTSCQGEEQVIHPQLAVANFMCAAKILHLLYAWETYYTGLGFKESREVEKHLPLEISSSIYNSEHHSSEAIK